MNAPTPTISRNDITDELLAVLVVTYLNRAIAFAVGHHGETFASADFRNAAEWNIWDEMPHVLRTDDGRKVRCPVGFRNMVQAALDTMLADRLAVAA